MKLFTLHVLIFCLLLMGSDVLLANPGDFACRGALTKLTDAQQAVQAKERELQQSQSKVKVAFAELEVCNLRPTTNGNTIWKCAKDRVEAPRKIREQAEVEIELQDAIHKFQTLFEHMSRICLEPLSHHINTGGPVYP